MPSTSIFQAKISIPWWSRSIGLFSTDIIIEIILLLYLKFETLKKKLKYLNNSNKINSTDAAAFIITFLFMSIYLFFGWVFSLSQEKLKLFKSQEGAEKQQKRENTRQKTTSKLEWKSASHQKQAKC